jgi:DNA modification methylase
MDKRIETLTGDSLVLLQSLEAESVDLVVTDPPYNLGKNYGNNNDSLNKEAYLSFTREWLAQVDRVLKKNGSLYIFMGVRFISYLFIILNDELNYEFNSWITWHYTQGMGKKRGYSPRHDDILFFNKSKEFNFYLDNIRIPQKYYRARNNMRGANPGDVWKFSHVHYSNPNRKNHPTQKPEGLIERMVLASSDENDLVLDPFSGSGTTQRVCQQLNRRCRGIEINPQFVDMTEARLIETFEEFDSIDERFYRIPNDLRDEKIRNSYLNEHQHYFLQNHPSYLKVFHKEISDKYGESALQSFLNKQPTLL